MPAGPFAAATDPWRVGDWARGHRGDAGDQRNLFRPPKRDARKGRRSALAASGEARELHQAGRLLRPKAADKLRLQPRHKKGKLGLPCSPEYGNPVVPQRPLPMDRGLLSHNGYSDQFARWNSSSPIEVRVCRERLPVRTVTADSGYPMISRPNGFVASADPSWRRPMRIRHAIRKTRHLPTAPTFTRRIPPHAILVGRGDTSPPWDGADQACPSESCRKRDGSG